MSLNLGPTEQRSPLKSILVAALVMAAIVVVLYFTTWRKMAALTVPKADVFAPHTVMKAMPNQMHVVGVLQEAQDNVYVVAHVHFTNNMALPMTYNGATAAMYDTAGAVLDGSVISARDLPRLEQSFPDLTPLVKTPLNFGDDFAPKSTREADIVLLFGGIPQSTWTKRKSATLTLQFAHQEPMTTTIP